MESHKTNVLDYEHTLSLCLNKVEHLQCSVFKKQSRKIKRGVLIKIPLSCKSQSSPKSLANFVVLFFDNGSRSLQYFAFHILSELGFGPQCYCVVMVVRVEVTKTIYYLSSARYWFQCFSYIKSFHSPTTLRGSYYYCFCLTCQETISRCALQVASD